MSAGRLAAIGFVLLVVLHLDFWRPEGPLLLFGWLPSELAYRAVYVVLAWIYIVWICAAVWRTEDADR